MANKILFGSDAREAAIRGLNKVADAVGSTLGPKASNVTILKTYQNPIVTHDGVTVAKNIVLEDPFEDVGAQLIREAASKTNDVAGDGTTTATVLARALVIEADKAIKNGANAQSIKSGIEKGVKIVLEELKKSAQPVKTDDEILQVATISSSSEFLGGIVADAVKKAGKDGVISLNEVPTDELTISHTQGLEFDRGYISSYFITDDKNRAAIASPYIFITDRTLSSQTDIIPLLEVVTKDLQSKDLFIIAEDVSGEALATLVVNRMRGSLNVVAVKAPAFGMRRKQILEDIAVLTGATVISEDTGRPLNSVQSEDLGRAERVEVSKESSLVVNGAGDYDKLDARIKSIKSELKEAANEFDKDIIKQRLAKLSNGVVVINIGGTTEVEMKERKYRIEDAVNATQAAIEEGIVPGGETAMLYGSRALETLQDQGDIETGIRILEKSLKAPFLKLIENAGITDGELIAQAMRAESPMGINVMTGQITDLLKEGVLDPVKVSRSALSNAASVAAMIITNACSIVEGDKKNES